jgi:hypothetical protein
MICPEVRKSNQHEQLRLGLMDVGRQMLAATDDHSFHAAHIELTSFSY